MNETGLQPMLYFPGKGKGLTSHWDPKTVAGIGAARKQSNLDKQLRKQMLSPVPGECSRWGMEVEREGIRARKSTCAGS